MIEYLIELWPAWIAVGLSTLLAFNRLIEESQKFAKFFGSWGRDRHERYRARAAEERKDENEAIQALEGRVDAVFRVTSAQSKELADLRTQQEIVGEYAEYEAAWHRRIRALAVSHNPSDCDCVPIDQIPPHMTWWAFEATYKMRGGGRDWWALNGNTPPPPLVSV